VIGSLKMSTRSPSITISEAFIAHLLVSRSRSPVISPPPAAVITLSGAIFSSSAIAKGSMWVSSFMPSPWSTLAPD
jgi:hypothetical protein